MSTLLKARLHTGSHHRCRIVEEGLHLYDEVNALISTR
jgi:hypothetical protein